MQGELDIVQLAAPGPLDEVRKHDLSKYCPWCMDQVKPNLGCNVIENLVAQQIGL